MLFPYWGKKTRPFLINHTLTWLYNTFEIALIEVGPIALIVLLVLNGAGISTGLGSFFAAFGTGVGAVFGNIGEALESTFGGAF